MVHVLWRDIDGAGRAALEQQFRLTEPMPLANGAWAYVPADTSTATLRAIVTHPAVADTDGVNRRTFAIADSPPLTPRRGGLIAGAPSWMAGGMRLAGYALAGFAGMLLAAALLIVLVEHRVGAEATAALARTVRSQRVLPSLRSSDRSRETIVVVALFLLTVAWRFLTFTGFSNDHYAHLVMAQQVLMGDVPIRDFADPGWPLTYTLTLLGWLVAGKIMATEWVINTAGFAIGAACTAVVARRLSGSLIVAIGVTVIEILIFPRAYSYPKILMYAAGAWALLTLAAQPSSTRRLLLTAALIAVAFLFRHDHGLFIGLGAAVCVAVASRADGWRPIVRRLALLTASTFCFLLPWIVFVILNGGLLAYFEAGIDYSRAEADATRLDAWPIRGDAATLFWLFWLVPFVCVGMALHRLIRQRERWPGEIAAILGLVTIAALVNASFLRQSLEVRVSDAVVPAAVLGAWALGVCWTPAPHRGPTRLVMQAVSVALMLMAAAAAARLAGFAGQYDDAGMRQGFAGVRSHAAEVSERLRSPYRDDVPSRYSLALGPFFAYVDRCTSSADRLIVTGEFPDVLVLAGRRFAGDAIVFGSWYSSVTHQDRTLARLRSAPALFVLHTGDADGFRRKYAQVAEYVDAEYQPMADVPVPEDGTIQILVKTSRRPHAVDATTGWPCFK